MLTFGYGGRQAPALRILTIVQLSPDASSTAPRSPFPPGKAWVRKLSFSGIPIVGASILHSAPLF